MCSKTTFSKWLYKQKYFLKNENWYLIIFKYKYVFIKLRKRAFDKTIVCKHFIKTELATLSDLVDHMAHWAILSNQSSNLVSAKFDWPDLIYRMSQFLKFWAVGYVRLYNNDSFIQSTIEYEPVDRIWQILCIMVRNGLFFTNFIYTPSFKVI